MPCYQTVTNQVELGQHTDTELLEKALQEEGYQTGTQLRNAHTKQPIKGLTFSKPAQQINGTFRYGKLNITSPAGTKVDTDAIKRKYSEQVIKAKAKKHGFKVEKKPGNKWILSKIANRM